MENYGYEKPVSELLYLGKSELNSNPHTWIDYIDEYGFTSEHIPELQRLYEDKQFQNSDFWDEPEGIAFVHVLRVLGQLKDESALPFLLNVAETEEDSDWVWETIPVVLSLFGAEILPKVKESINRVREQYKPIQSGTLLHTLAEMLKRCPEIQQDIYDYCMDILRDYETNNYSLNGELAFMFSNNKYEPALPLLEQAFKAQRVDELVMGDYYDVLVEYGLEEADPDRKPEYFSPEMDEFRAMAESLDELAPKPKLSTVKSARNTKKKKKAKRKQAKKSQRKNRKRK